MGHSTYRPTSCFYHLINMLIQVIFYDTVHSSYMGRQATCAATVYCLRYIYSLIFHSPVDSRASATGGPSHSPLVVRQVDILIIILATWWWNPSSTLSMDIIINQFSLLYNKTNCKTTWYRIPYVRTFDPVFNTTLPTITYRRCAFRGYW